MYRVTILPQDKSDQWDNFVHSHPSGWLTHLSQWSEILSSLLKQCQLLRIAIIEDGTGEIKAGLPLYQIKSPVLGKRMIGAPLATFYEPLVSSTEELNLLLKSARDFLERSKGKYIKIKLFQTKDLFLQVGHKLKTEFITHLLPLDDKPENIFKRFDRTCVRKNIRRAEKSNLRARIITDPNELKSFFKLYSKTRQRLGLPAIPFSFFRSAFKYLVPSGKAFYILAEYRNIPIASLLIFIYKNRCSAEALGWDITFKSLRPVPFIYWEAIKLSYNSGCKYFDFGRTSVTNRDLIFFKRNWGTEELELPEFIYPEGEDEREVRLKLDKFKKVANLIFTALPQSAYSLLSSTFYRYFAE